VEARAPPRTIPTFCIGGKLDLPSTLPRPAVTAPTQAANPRLVST